MLQLQRSVFVNGFQCRGHKTRSPTGLGFASRFVMLANLSNWKSAKAVDDAIGRDCCGNRAAISGVASTINRGQFARTGVMMPASMTLALICGSQALDAAQSAVEGRLQRHRLKRRFGAADFGAATFHSEAVPCPHSDIIRPAS